MIEIEPTDYFVVAAVSGSLFYHLSGYFDAKKQNPSIKYLYGYMLQTIFVAIGVACGYSVSNMEWSHYNLLLAFISGMGGTVAISKFFKGLKNKKSQIPYH